MIVERAEHPEWLSNAYLVAEGPGGSGVLVDGNGVVGPLLERIESDGIAITHVILTHHHVDHVVDTAMYRERFGVPVVAHELTAPDLPDDGRADEWIGDGDTLRSGDLEIRAIHTPGHAAGHIALLFGESDCLTADVLFRGTVGGTRAPGATGFDDLRASVMDRLMSLPAETRVHPGHREATTVGEEWEANAFVRVWRGLDPEGTESCRVGPEETEATLVLWAPDYDGTNKAWVRFHSGEQAIVGGSQVQR
ncbi:MAG: MBL fold metallo-hydrolase [Solirubrobacterales bacterium]|nr:MBL fold metallo-hydrolase [Solirubrobacterales bacterium]